ncbi:acetamidase/formamidase family protein, partial [Streptomyces sp. NPDC004227]
MASSRHAAWSLDEYFKKLGYSGEQAYLLFGSALIEGRISGVVDIPNACCSLYLPTAMFNFGVGPNQGGREQGDPPPGPTGGRRAGTPQASR